jgi:hypothetical protein
MVRCNVFSSQAIDLGEVGQTFTHSLSASGHMQQVDWIALGTGVNITRTLMRESSLFITPKCFMLQATSQALQPTHFISSHSTKAKAVGLA